MINLVSKSPAETKILDYLNKNASEELINKINNGTPFTKDNKPFINKKTLSGFMKYANNEARKTVENGSNCACIEDDVVFGWAMHYFEEEAIEEKLYCLDGTPYGPPKKEVKKPTTSTTTTPVIPKKEEKPQMSFFDMIKTDTPKVEDVNVDDEPSQEEIDEAMEELAEEQNTKVEEVKPDTQKHWINDTTYVDEDGTVHEVSSSFDNSLVDKLKEIIGDIFVCAK